MDDPEAKIPRPPVGPPSCIDGFRPVAAELATEGDRPPHPGWRLRCRCGGEHGRILGHWLGATGDGHAKLISPIAFECGTCGRTTAVIDTARHGYHAEVAAREGGVGSAKRRGEGPPSAWRCPRCGGERSGLVVAFLYSGAVLDLAEDEPGWPIRDFFTAFLSCADCLACGHRSEPTDFGKL